MTALPQRTDNRRLAAVRVTEAGQPNSGNATQDLRVVLEYGDDLDGAVDALLWLLDSRRQPESAADRAA